MYYSAVPIICKQANWGDKRSFYSKISYMDDRDIGKKEGGGIFFVLLFLSFLLTTMYRAKTSILVEE